MYVFTVFQKRAAIHSCHIRTVTAFPASNTRRPDSPLTGFVTKRMDYKNRKTRYHLLHSRPPFPPKDCTTRKYQAVHCAVRPRAAPTREPHTSGTRTPHRVLDASHARTMHTARP